jgi:hypothetical protein
MTFEYKDANEKTESFDYIITDDAVEIEKLEYVITPSYCPFTTQLKFYDSENDPETPAKGILEETTKPTVDAKVFYEKSDLIDKSEKVEQIAVAETPYATDFGGSPIQLLHSITVNYKTPCTTVLASLSLPQQLQGLLANDNFSGNTNKWTYVPYKVEPDFCKAE